MKSEWKVFIKGVPDRGDEVIKKLTDRGAKNPYGYEGNKLVYLYYIWHDGSIHVELIDNEYGQIIMENYREVKLPEKWKDGNILFSPQYKRFAIYAYEISVPYLVVAYYCFDENFLTHSFPRIKINDFRLATPQEIEQFYELLHKHGKDWDTEKKQLVDWEWRPSIKEAYYTLEIDRGDVVVRTRVYFDDDIDKKLIKNCNFFCTIKEAEKAAERVKKALKGEI